ncbi:MAG: endopeptidase La [Candidatus Moeniiplasma glomeromycotorum]|nr:endopeptidase La [Candidatus Moeniiplasma glomeromycotorum]MCE8162551.1 endopeptidase La [Candidatus Moeniiplasma glomeromycotorum]MCE8166522.1 endopeptidase La [Candidatus Moeniiplasma glomeromycotorum]MCE8167006.1 endopeptidase La [Candidatus Moeniiplasma glomeromycotorum]
MTQIPLLIVPNFFLFPQCSNNLVLENNPLLKEIIYQTQKYHQGKLLVIPKPLELSANRQEIITAGTLAEINWGGLDTNNLELILNSLKEVQLHGLARINKIFDLSQTGEIWKANYQTLPEIELEPQKMNELTEKLFQNLVWIIERSKLISPPFEGSPFAVVRESKIGNFIDLITQNGQGISSETKLKILTSANLEGRLAILLNFFVEQETKERIDKQQAEYYRQEKRKVINQKLKGGGSEEIKDYLQKIEKEPYPSYVKEVVRKEIERCESLPFNSNEAGIIKQYVEWLIKLPWWQKTSEVNDLELAHQRLDQKHYNLKEVKEEIIEYLSIRKRVLTTPQKSEKSFGEVICLEGPPGVGKSSLVSTIAEAMGRKFISVSLSGVYDAAEILGHRTTYIGAMPGRIVQKMKEVQVINPVFLIDEIDKISSDYRTNPAHALLRVLDPKFNKEFIDSYLGENVPYNLSEVMFICTANNTYNLPRPLRDRMKIIRIPPYTDLEKAEIAKNYLIPSYFDKYNFSTNEINFQETAIRKIISDYTTKRGGEGGVRELSRQIDTVFRKFSVKLEKEPSFRVEITPSNLHEFLNKRDYEPFHPQIYSRPGVVNGLAYSGYSGDVLQIEVVFYEKKDGGIEVTGNLGEVMKESIKVALSYIKSNHQELGINPELFSQRVIHINTIEGAVPKEGPSAGIAITSAIISALTKRVIPADLGMTGTISLHGKVGEIGAVKAKVIGGYNKGLKRFIIPKTNQKDLENIPAEAKIFPVEDYQEVLKIIFEEKKAVKRPIKNNLPMEKKRRRISSSI